MSMRKTSSESSPSCANAKRSRRITLTCSMRSCLDSHGQRLASYPLQCIIWWIWCRSILWYSKYRQIYVYMVDLDVVSGIIDNQMMKWGNDWHVDMYSSILYNHLLGNSKGYDRILIATLVRCAACCPTIKVPSDQLPNSPLRHREVHACCCYGNHSPSATIIF